MFCCPGSLWSPRPPWDRGSDPGLPQTPCTYPVRTQVLRISKPSAVCVSRLNWGLPGPLPTQNLVFKLCPRLSEWGVVWFYSSLSSDWWTAAFCSSDAWFMNEVLTVKNNKQPNTSQVFRHLVTFRHLTNCTLHSLEEKELLFYCSFSFVDACVLKFSGTKGSQNRKSLDSQKKQKPCRLKFCCDGRLKPPSPKKNTSI